MAGELRLNSLWRCKVLSVKLWPLVFITKVCVTFEIKDEDFSMKNFSVYQTISFFELINLTGVWDWDRKLNQCKWRKRFYNRQIGTNWPVTLCHAESRADMAL